MLKVKSENKDNLIINYNNDGNLEEYHIYIDDKELNLDNNENKGKVINNE